MVDGPASEDATLFPKRVGERLRDARVAAGLALADVAQRTRVPMRHLEAIENSDFSGLPSVTYAMGFTKAYARALGVDEVSIARDVRAEIAQNWQRDPPKPEYITADPKRVPSRGVAMVGLLIAILALLGAGLWFGTDLFRAKTPVAELAAPVTPNEIAVPPPGQSVSEAPAPSASGQVALTATDTVWVRIYDAADKTLLMKEMAPGERYDVPGDANGPMINVGRPDKLALTINGSNVPALGDGKVAIKDVPISATALLARAAPDAGTGNSSAP